MAMTTFQQILIPIDFSTHSTLALKLGADLARRYRATVTLLHVHDPLPYALPADYPLLSAEQRRGWRAELEKALETAKLRAETAGAPRVQCRLLEGPAADRILEYAGEGPFDLIVLGTHGRQGWKRAMLGSVAERVVRAAPCPVLTVRGPGDLVRQAAQVWPVSP